MIRRLVCWLIGHDMGYRGERYQCLRCGWDPARR